MARGVSGVQVIHYPSPQEKSRCVVGLELAHVKAAASLNLFVNNSILKYYSQGEVKEKKMRR